MDSNLSELQPVGLEELRPVTALFADIVGSTGLGERLSLSEIRALVGECVSRMTEAVELYGGVVRSFMGDGIAAFFGIEGAREDDSIRGCLAALRIMDVVGEYANEIEAAWGVQALAVRVGVNSGRVATGLVGGSNPQHVALGDPVNVAARLQGASEPGAVIVGARVAARVASHFRMERVGALELKGRVSKVEAWRLAAFEGLSEREPLGQFVGRDFELSRLKRAAQDLELGRGQVVLVLGDAGIGKTRLLGEVQKGIGGATVLSARCSGDYLPRPYGPYVDILRDWLNVSPSTREVLVRIRLLARLEEIGLGNRADVAPYLEMLLGLDLDSRSMSDIQKWPEEQRGAALRKAYEVLLRTLSDEAPVVVVLDDFERCDEATAELTRDLCRLVTTSPVVIAVAMRPERDTEAWRVRLFALDELSHRTTELQVAALGLEESDEIVALSDPEGLLPAATRRSLTLRADGNPLYLEELVRAALANSDVIVDVEGIELPPALEELLVARIDRLGGTARRLLQLAAVCGRRFSGTVLEDGAAAEGIPCDLEALLRSGIICEDGRAPLQWYAFKHVLHQEAALSTLSDSRLRGLNARVAKALEKSVDLDERLEAIAGHYMASGNSQKAIEYLMRAADRAAALASLVDALRLFEQARDLASASGNVSAQARLARRVAEVRMQTGAYGAAVECWKEVLAAASTAQERAVALLELARTDHELRQSDRAEATCLEALALHPDERTRVDLELLLGRIALRRDHLDDARSHLVFVEEGLARRSAVQELELASLWTAFCLQGGELAQAEECAKQVIELAESSGRFSDALIGKRNLGLIHVVQGRLVEAHGILAGVLDAAMQFGHSIRAQETVSNLVMTCYVLGRLREGRELAEDGLSWLNATAWRAALLLNLGCIESELGDTRQAHEHLGEVMKEASVEEEARLMGAFASLALARLELDAGRVDEARAHTALAVKASEEIGGRLDVRVKACVRLAQIAMRCDEARVAMEHAREAVELAAHCDRTESPLAWRVLGVAQMAAGVPEARESLERSLGLATEMGMRLDEARAHVALGSLDGDPRGPQFREARRIFSDCECELGLQELNAAIACFV